MRQSDDAPRQRARHADSRIWGRLPSQRRRPTRRPSKHPRVRARLAASSGLVALLGLGVAVTALWLLPGQHRLGQTAVQLRDSGLSVVADSARVVQEGTGRNAQDALEVSFRTREQQMITVRLLGSGTDRGLKPPTQPITVFYDPVRPHRAMAADDLPYYIDDAVAASLTTSLLGVLVAVVGGGGWWMWRRSEE